MLKTSFIAKGIMPGQLWSPCWNQDLKNQHADNKLVHMGGRGKGEEKKQNSISKEENEASNYNLTINFQQNVQ